MDKDKTIILFDNDAFWSDYYNGYERDVKLEFGDEWNLSYLTSENVVLENDNGDEKEVSREDTYFRWANADEYANEHLEMWWEDVVRYLNSIKADRPFIYRGDWKRWNGIRQVGGVVPGKLSRILGFLESDSVAVGVDKETRELVVLIHDHDGYADLIVSRAIEDIDEEIDVDEIKTEPIGDEVLKAFGF